MGGGGIVLFGDDGEGGRGCGDGFYEAEVAGLEVGCHGGRRRRHCGCGSVLEKGFGKGKKRRWVRGSGAHCKICRMKVIQNKKIRKILSIKHLFLLRH